MIARAAIGLTCAFGFAPAHAQAVTYVHADALGSPVLETNPNGAVVRTVDYRAYGEEVLSGAKDGPAFTGHYRDAGTGLVYMQQRYYDPQAGRFVSIDPVAADPGTGGNFNRYWYAGNNPHRYVDPDGRRIQAAKKYQTEVLTLINELSTTQYHFNAGGELEATGRTNPGVTSQSYSTDIDEAIASSKVVEIRIGQTFDPDRSNADDRLVDIDAVHGGGITADISSVRKLVQISGNTGGRDVDVNKDDVFDSPANVLRHEITGHAVPQLLGKYGNARIYDNVSRIELGLPKLALRDLNGNTDPVK